MAQKIIPVGQKLLIKENFEVSLKNSQKVEIIIKIMMLEVMIA